MMPALANGLDFFSKSAILENMILGIKNFTQFA